MKHKAAQRIVVLFTIFLLGFFGVSGHLAYIQLYQANALSQKAIIQQTQLIPLQDPVRGDFLDCNRRPLVSSKIVSRILVVPTLLKNKEEVTATIASIIGKDAKWVQFYMTGRPKVIPFNLSLRQIYELQQHSLSGILIEKFTTRGRTTDFAKHLIGYLGKDDKTGQWQGRFGLEAIYENILNKGQPETALRFFLDGKGNLIPGLGYQKEVANKSKQNDIVLTIDSDIQQIVEQTLDAHNIVNAAVVVMDTTTGNIKALASRPNLFFGQTVGQAAYNEERFVNHTTAMYQPGSVFKVVVASAAIQEKKVTKDTMYFCAGDKDELVSCYNKKGHGFLTFEKAIVQSCNPTFARVGLTLGAKDLIRYARAFGLGNTEIIGLNSGKNNSSLNKILDKDNLVNASIGQWPVEANPVQVTAMMNVIANNGKYVTPRLVDSILDGNGRTIQRFSIDKGSQVLNTETTSFMQTALKKVTTEGSGHNAWVEQWGSAGKTGSAQVGQEKVNAWFSGYSPVNNPTYVVTIMIKNGESGGGTAAPIFKEIMEKILKCKEIPIHSTSR